MSFSIKKYLHYNTCVGKLIVIFAEYITPKIATKIIFSTLIFILLNGNGKLLFVVDESLVFQVSCDICDIDSVRSIK